MPGLRTIYHFVDYKLFVNSRIESLPKQGHGEYRRMATALGASTTLMSQIFRGEKQISLEMAAEVCDYLRLEEFEAQYFLLLVEYQKSGSENLKKKLLRRIQNDQKKANAPSPQKGHLEQRHLSREDQETYFSSWVYAGLRHLCCLEGLNSPQVLAERMGLQVFHVKKILDFLISRNLITNDAGQLSYGPAQTQLSPGSLRAHQHHQNWRLQAMNKATLGDEQNLFFTGPMLMTKEQAAQLRKELVEFIARLSSTSAGDDAEVVRCLNLDFFEY